MKVTVTKLVKEEVEISLPAYRKDHYAFHKIYKDNDSIRVLVVSDTLIADLLHSSESNGSICSATDFYQAYARTSTRLKQVSGIEELMLSCSDKVVLNQTYLEQVAEDCKHDCEPDHEERAHMEEMEYRSMQMGSL